MGWIYDGVSDEEHEGYSVGVLASGVIPTYATGGEWFEMEFQDGWWSSGHDSEDPGMAEPAWLLPACVCGWRGEREDYDGQAEAEARAQWDAHMDEVTVYLLTVARASESLVDLLEVARKAGEFDERPLAVIKALRVTQAHISSQINSAVGAARAQELSWELIGDALGVTRQTAHERYRNAEAMPAQPQ
jgi:hypothetical protein